MVNFNIVLSIYFMYNKIVISMKKLKELRIKNNYTYADMAQLIGISATYYWQLENGDRRLYYKMAIKIAKIFNLKPDDIFYNDIP